MCDKCMKLMVIVAMVGVVGTISSMVAIVKFPSVSWLIWPFGISVWLATGGSIIGLCFFLYSLFRPKPSTPDVSGSVTRV